MFTKKQMIATLCLGLLIFGAQATDQKPSDKTADSRFNYVIGFALSGALAGSYTGTEACKKFPVPCAITIPAGTAIGGAAGLMGGLGYYFFYNDKKTSNEKPPQS
jgi:hypothetical protein